MLSVNHFIIFQGDNIFNNSIFKKLFVSALWEMYITINISTPNKKNREKTARGFAKLRRIIYIENKNQMIKDMDIPKMIKKVDYSEYEGRYDESVNDVLTTSPDNLSVETMR